jgi:enoyl-CoA hydratase
MITEQKGNVVQVTVKDRIARVKICREEALNALNPDVLTSLILTFDRLSTHTLAPEKRRDSIVAVIIEGAGDKAFVAGADIRSMIDLGPRAIADYVELGQRALRTIEKFPVPVIAAVHGYALGGGLELALACDLIVASKESRFGQPEVNLGIIPGFGGTQRLITRCGVGAAKFLCFTGEIITGEQGVNLRLVDVLVDGDAREGAQKLAENIGKKGPRAVQAVKRVINSTQESLILGGLQLEVETFLEVFQNSEREEGMRAFTERRVPSFFEVTET